MRHDRRPVRHPVRRARTFTLTGERAEVLADRLLQGRADRIDLVWDEVEARTGRARRLIHDWDPVGRTFRLEARGG